MSCRAKQVLIVRRDLQMSKGELVVQVTHAASKALLKAISKEGRADQLRIDPDDWVYLEAPEGQESPLTHWFQSDMAKVYGCVDSEEALLELDRRAREAGIVTALIQEEGLTEFPGTPVYTALALEPLEASRADAFAEGLARFSF